MSSKAEKIISTLLVAALVFGLYGAMLTAGTVETLASPVLVAADGPQNGASATGYAKVDLAAVNTKDDPAGGIYVSPTGNDAGATGSISKPYKSINTALAACKPGDTVILRGGTYREGVNVRIRTPRITIKSAKGEWAVIDLTKFNKGSEEDSGVYFDVDSSGGRLQGVEVIGGWYAVCMETKWDWGDPKDRAGASNIIIEDCKLHDSRYDVVKVKPNCDNITIRNNEIYNSGRAFDGKPRNGEDNAEGIDNVNGDNMVVQNNYIHDICSTGIYAKGGPTDVLIENNRIETAYAAGIMVGFDTSPEFFDITVNPKYYENIRGIVRNNLIIGTGWEGLGFYGSKDAQVYNNTLVNVCNGGQYHSAIYFGLTYQDWKDYANRPANINPSIHHNIVCQPSSFVRPMIEIRYANEHELGGMSALDGSPVMSQNCYFISGKKASFYDHRPGSTLENAGLAGWQSHIRSDSGSIEADPRLNADYIATNPLCEGMGFSSGQASPVSAGMARFTKTREYTPGQFTDVNENEWYGVNKNKSIATAYGYNLVRGYDDATFKPNGNITVAELVTIAVNIRRIYAAETAALVMGNPWYQVYVDYALASGILSAGDFKASDYSRSATRGEMAYVFSRCLPAGEYAGLNTVKALPDVKSATPYREHIIKLYEAGIISGNDDAGTFFPNSNMTRAEAATVVSRIILPSTRLSGKTYG